MLVFDQLKRNDPTLRTLSLTVLAGLLVLLAGLWWVQVVSFRNYQNRQETQSFRTVRVPAVRGKIVDQRGVVLAENRPSFTVGLYLEELSPQFRAEYRRLRPMQMVTNAPFYKRWLGLSTVKTQAMRLKPIDQSALAWQSRSRVVSNLVTQLSAGLDQPPRFDSNHFQRHYETRRALPYPVLANLNPAQVAAFEEQSLGQMGANLDIQSLRVYPLQATAAHVVGYLTRESDRSYEGELAEFSYRLPDFRGVVGIEAGFDTLLRGRAGAKSVLVNYLGYKQSETVWSAAQPGQNVVLTLDVRVQQAAEQALLRAGTRVCGAAVVMDVRNGDILAMASSPTPNPNHFVHGFPPGEYDKLNDERLRPQINRATQENFAPGSIFKTVVALACLENGLNPDATYHVQPNPANPAKGIIHVGRQAFRDLAPPGDYDFRRALLRSSNSYFITNGIRVAGIQRIIELSRKFHLGEKANLPTKQETTGILPTLQQVTSAHWRDGDTANICIGQGPIAVTPLQMAVMTSAIANGGTVYWPRLVDRIEPQDLGPGQQPVRFPAGRVRDRLGVRTSSLRELHIAMLADTEDPEATAYKPFREYYQTPGAMRVCGKTGTADVADEHNRQVGKNTWFIAFAPYDQPKYAVVVMVEDVGSGGSTCAPVARDIFKALQLRETAEHNLVARQD